MPKEGYRHYLSDDDTDIPRSSWYRFCKQQQNSGNVPKGSYELHYQEHYTENDSSQHVMSVTQNCEMQVPAHEEVQIIEHEHFELDDTEIHLPFCTWIGESEVVNVPDNVSYADDIYDCTSDDEYFDTTDYFENEPTHDIQYTSLDDLLGSENFDEKMEVCINVNKSELLLAILKFSLRNSLTNSAMQELCIMLNSLVSRPIVPETRYSINKLFGRDGHVQYYGVCPICSKYREKFDRGTKELFCSACEKSFSVVGDEANIFVILDVKDKVKKLIEENSDFFNSIMENEQSDGFIRDIHDGKKYIQFRQLLPIDEKKLYATCILNTDGSPVFKKSNCSIVPIQISINEVPPDIRLMNPITWALWFGKGKPNMDLYLETFVKTFNESPGIECEIDNTIKSIELYTICSCVDSVARAPMQGMVQFNGHYGCPWCLHPGVPIKHKKKKTIKYPSLDTITLERTESETLIHMELASNRDSPNKQPVFGVKRVPALVDLHHFDIIKGFVPDVMHLLFLGICRQFAKYWFETTGKPYSLSNYVEFIDKMILNLKLPHQLARLSKSIKERQWWNSRDWENWCLHFSSPILSEIPHFTEYVEHWNLVIEAVKLLSTNNIHENDIIHADNLLKVFVANTEIVHSQSNDIQCPSVTTSNAFCH